MERKQICGWTSKLHSCHGLIKCESFKKGRERDQAARRRGDFTIISRHQNYQYEDDIIIRYILLDWRIISLPDFLSTR
jgi:hypothetical protein